MNEDSHVLRSSPSVLKQLKINRSCSKPRVNDFDFFVGNFFRDDRMGGIITVDNEEVEEENGKDILRKVFLAYEQAASICRLDAFGAYSKILSMIDKTIFR